jgi:hypothetical protein
MKVEYEKSWMEAVMVCCKVLSQNVLRGAEEAHENIRSPSRYWNSGLANFEVGC